MTLKNLFRFLNFLLGIFIGYSVVSLGKSLILGRSINPIGWYVDVKIILEIFISITVITALSIFIHELGHLVFGFATGYKFNFFRVGSLLWSKENGKIRFSVSKDSFFTGQCLMEPVENEEEFKYFWYNFGGVFFNLMGLLICLLSIVIGNVTGFWYTSLIIGIAINGAFVLINLIPIASLSNDGYNIYIVSKYKEAKREFHKTLLLNSALKKGKRLRDFSAETFKVEEGANLENFWTAQLVLYEFARLEDLGDIESAIKELQRLNIEKLSTLLKGTVKLEFLNHYLIRESDYELAKELYECNSVKKIIKMELPGTTRVHAAYTYFVKGDKIKGKSLLEKAEKQLETIPYKGLQEMEFEELEKLKALME